MIRYPQSWRGILQTATSKSIPNLSGIAFHIPRTFLRLLHIHPEFGWNPKRLSSLHSIYHFCSNPSKNSRKVEFEFESVLSEMTFNSYSLSQGGNLFEYQKVPLISLQTRAYMAQNTRIYIFRQNTATKIGGGVCKIRTFLEVKLSLVEFAWKLIRKIETLTHFKVTIIMKKDWLVLLTSPGIIWKQK